MSKVCMVERNKHRERLAKRFSKKREALKSIIKDANTPAEERFSAVVKLSKLPRNSSKGRIKHRCAFSGRGRGNIRRYGVSRIYFREMALFGMIPGITKSSW